MTLRHMRIFQKIYETQSVTRAAEALHMTQPAVTAPCRSWKNTMDFACLNG